MTQSYLGLYTLEQMVGVLEQAVRMANNNLGDAKYSLRYAETSFDEQALCAYIVYVDKPPIDTPKLSPTDKAVGHYTLTIDNTNLSSTDYITKSARAGGEWGLTFDKHNTDPGDDVYCKLKLEPEVLLNEILLPMMAGYNKVYLGGK